MNKFYKSDFLDHGTFGKVYKMSSKDGVFAVKKYTEEDGITTSIINEIMFLSRMKHKNIIEKIELIIDDNVLYLIMPLYLTNLFMWTKKNKKELDFKIYLNQTDQIINQVLNGLEYIHKNYYIHGDIKPTNIILNPTDLSDVKIIDFGLSYNQTLINNFNIHEIQTIWYRAPEMLKKQRYDYKIDIWSLGLVYLETIMGTAILKGNDDIDQLKLINNFNLFDFIIDSFKNPVDIFSQTKVINKMLNIFPELRYDYIEQIPKYNLDYILNNETCIIDLHNKISKIVNAKILKILFIWLCNSANDFTNRYDVFIYASHLTIRTLVNMHEKNQEVKNLQPDVQLISLACLTIADSILNIDNIHKKKLVLACDEEYITIDSLIETEFKILNLLGADLHLITPLNVLHFYRQKYQDFYSTNYLLINSLLCALHISGAAFIYKPNYLVQGIFSYIMNDTEKYPDITQEIKKGKNIIEKLT